jgi:hypothetical protein
VPLQTLIGNRLLASRLYLRAALARHSIYYSWPRRLTVIVGQLRFVVRQAAISFGLG